MFILLKLTRENNQLRRNDDKRPREENSHTQNHRTPIVERLGGPDTVLGQVRSPQRHQSISVSRCSQYPKEQSLSVPEYSSAAQIDLERDMQHSHSPVLQRGQYRPARGNRRFDRSPGGSDSSEYGYNGSRNTRRRTNGGYQMVGDRSGSQQWARSHRTRALHNSVGGYARTRELNPHRVEANFKQRRQDSVEPGWSPERRNHDVVAQAFKNAISFDKSGLYNSLTLKPPETVQDLLVRAERYATVQEDSKYKHQGDFSSDRGKQEQQHRDKDIKKHNKDAKTSVSQSQKQDGRPSKDLTIPELSDSLLELYDKLKGKISKPFLMKPDTEGRRDKLKKCNYFNDFGHTLNNCYAFKKEISRMADGGQLKENLKGS
ncbi:hypothetical protein IFM89_013515 [Coptis chinensis]|uniref:Uncharacterized protein n=1 Tax=Coptis chinensis TaxID=261450 RepID=A0A835H3I2_9MAGN|nr:hypothetical protein IFM89_013515 [Coptis chinensis]